MSALVNLGELCVSNANCISDLKMVASNLVNLKRIHFGTASIDQIMMFIARTAKMELIKVNNLMNGTHFNTTTNIINLLALNRAHEQLEGAEKVTLLINEDIFFATKWAVKDIDLRMIGLNRDTSYQWNHDFNLTGMPIER